MVKNPPTNGGDIRKTCVQSLGQEDPLDEGMATHSNIHTWRIPWTEEPGGLWSVGSQSRTRMKRLSTHTCTSVVMLDIVQSETLFIAFKNFYFLIMLQI